MPTNTTFGSVLMRWSQIGQCRVLSHTPLEERARPHPSARLQVCGAGSTAGGPTGRRYSSASRHFAVRWARNHSVRAAPTRSGGGPGPYAASSSASGPAPSTYRRLVAAPWAEDWVRHPPAQRGSPLPRGGHPPKQGCLKAFPNISSNSPRNPYPGL